MREGCMYRERERNDVRKKKHVYIHIQKIAKITSLTGEKEKTDIYMYNIYC